MSLVQKIDGVEITNRVRLTGGSRGGVTGWPSNAWYGEPGIAGLEIDDPLGDLIVVPWTTYTADETADTTRPRIFTGWITAVRVNRGPYRTGPGRVWSIDIIDQNAIFSFEVLRSSAASVRPAETDVARITALIASHAMGATPIHDNGRFDTTFSANFGPANYVTEYPQGVFESLGSNGRNFFAYWDDDEDEISLAYDDVQDNPLSSLAISNVIADQDATTFYPFIDAELTLDPQKQSSGVLLGYLGGYVYARDDDLFGPNEFSPVNFLRDDVYTTDRIGRLTTANAQVQAQLAARAAPAESITVTLRVPAAVVNEAHAGDAISVKFTHLPGYESETPMAIIRRNVIPSPGRRDFYDVTLELSNDTNTDLPPGGGDPGEVPPVAVCNIPDNAEIVQEEYESVSPVGGGPFSYTATWDTQPTAGHLLIAFFGHNTNNTTFLDGSTMAGWDLWERGAMASGGSACLSVFTKIAEPGESTSVALLNASASTECFVALQEWAGVDTVAASNLTVQDSSSASGAGFIELFPPDNTDVVLVGTIITNGGEFLNTLLGTIEDFVGVAWGAPDDDKFFVGHKVLENAQEPPIVPGDNSIAADFDEGIRWVSGGVVLTCSGTDPDAPCIASGQPNNRPEVVTMVGDDGTTACPFADGSLRVYFDNVDQTAALTAQDGDAGTFTTGTTPTPTEVVTVEYLGRVGA